MKLTKQLFSWSYNAYRLDDSDVALLRDKALSGDVEACYMYGRYLYCVRPEKDSVAKAYGYYEKALEGGVVDAKVAIAIMWYAGDFGMVNREKGDKLIDEAVDMGCDFAFQKFLLDMIIGLNGRPANPEKAIDILSEIMKAGDEAIWYYIMGRAVMVTLGMDTAVKWFKRAAEMGFVEANCFLVFARCHNDKWELKVEYGEYLDQLYEAYKAGDGLAAYMLANEWLNRYNELRDEMKSKFRDDMISKAIFAYNRGYGEAAVLLGDLYLKSLCDTEYDPIEAWAWYSKGGLAGCYEAFERLYELSADGTMVVEQVHSDQFALEGARLGSEQLKKRVVEIYKDGRLDDYSEEILNYYV